MLASRELRRICAIMLLHTGILPVLLTAVEAAPYSHVVSGNPWGVVMETATVLGWALERVELLPGNHWSITARLTIDELLDNNLAVTANRPVVFLAQPDVVIPESGRNVRPFMFGYNTATPWLINGIHKEDDLDQKLDGVQGTFRHADIPVESEIKANVMNLNETTKSFLTEQHPRIHGTSLLTITIPDSVFTILSSGGKSNSTREIIVGVALLASGMNGFAQFDYDFIFSGRVRVSDIQTKPVVRSFSVLTSTKYTFLKHTTMQVIETQSATLTFNYIAVITFGLEEGVTAAQVDCADYSSRFAIGSSISTIAAKDWRSVKCPTGSVNLTGCATEFFPHKSEFCVTETIWSNPITKKDAIAYRVRVQLAQYTTQPLPSDNIFIRIPVSALDTNDNSIIQSFINLRAPLLSSTIRCGAAVVWDPATDETDFITMSLYTGTMLTPMKMDAKGAPLVESTTAYPLVASTVSNLHARGILDSVVTIALIGDDEAFPELVLSMVQMIDLISIHVREESIYETLDSMVHTGAAYQVQYTTRAINTTIEFDSLCQNSNHCARRELMRGGVVLQPTHTHISTTRAADDAWFAALFNDIATDTAIADLFVRNAHTVFAPNDRNRRLVWVDSTYNWPDTYQDVSKDYMLLLASFDSIDILANP